LKRQEKSKDRDWDGGRARDFELVALPHTESLLRMALRLVRGDRAAADDLVQEVFLQAWRAFDQFERGTNCRGWLFRILFNLSNRRNEQLRARPALVSADDVPTSNVVALYAKPRQLEAAEVLEAFDLLPEEHATVLILGVIEGFTCKEIALMLGIPIGTVMSRLSRGREGLRKLLGVHQSGRARKSSVGS
jgi:RNA polymerase sigma-70 factor (ECF subfamily)